MPALQSAILRPIMSNPITPVVVDPTLVASFDLTSPSLDKRLRLSRASAASYVDSGTGQLVTVGSGVPRIDSLLGVVIENEARTNTVQNGSGWSFVNCVGTLNAIDPSGAIGAYSVTVNAGTFRVIDEPVVTGTMTIGNTVTTSRFIKPVTANRFQLLTGVGKSSAYANFFLDGFGSVTASGGGAINPSISYIGNGWYRVSFTYTVLSTSNSNGSPIYPILTGSEPRSSTLTYTGSETYITCFAQEEVGPFVSNYIPTTSAAVTRAADVLTGTGLINLTSGTMLVKFKEAGLFTSGSFPEPLRLRSSGNANMTTVYRPPAGTGFKLMVYSNSAKVAEDDFGTGNSAGNDIAIAASFGAGGYKAVANGGAVLTKTVAGPASPYTNIAIGNNKFFGTIKSVKIFNTEKTSSQMQGLTP